MDRLTRQVQTARRRLAAQRFLRAIPWFLFAALGIAAVLIAIDKYYPLGLPLWAWPTIAATAAVVSAAAWLWVAGQSEIDAAIEIDRRFHLHERVSSTYAMSETERESPIGQALIEDAGRAINRVEVADAFRVRLNRWALLPLVPAAAAFLIAVFLNPASQSATATPEKVEQAQVKKALEQIATRKLAPRVKETPEKEELTDLPPELAKFEKGLKQLASADVDKRQAMIKMNDMSKDLARRREELFNSDRLKEQMEQMKSLNQGPAEKVAEALKNGDLKQAGKEIEALKEQVKNGSLDENGRMEMAKQLEEMQKKLQAAVDKQEKATEDLKSKIAEKRAAGQQQEAEELERQLSKLEKQAPQMQQLQQMAQQLGQCAQCTKQGDAKGASEAMEQLQKGMSDLEQQLAESDLLDQALEQLADARDAMACKACNGEGCEECQGKGGMPQQANRGNRGMPGKGIARGHVDGEAGDEIRVGYYDTKVKQKTGRGAVTIAGKISGPNVKGQAQQEIQSEFEAVRGGTADPLADTKLPRGYRDHNRSYFDMLREGEKSEK